MRNLLSVEHGDGRYGRALIQTAWRHRVHRRYVPTCRLGAARPKALQARLERTMRSRRSSWMRNTGRAVGANLQSTSLSDSDRGVARTSTVQASSVRRDVQGMLW